jgi:hypothetical protein
MQLAIAEYLSHVSFTTLECGFYAGVMIVSGGTLNLPLQISTGVCNAHVREVLDDVVRLHTLV